MPLPYPGGNADPGLRPDGQAWNVSLRMFENRGTDRLSPDAFYKDWRLGWRITHEDDHLVGERAFAQVRNGTAVLDQGFQLIVEDGSLS